MYGAALRVLGEGAAAQDRFGVGDGFVMIIDEWAFRDGKIACYRGTEDTAQTEAVLRD